jgi:hypothetical protein
MALTDKLTAIANAIREKTGGTELLTLDQMPTEIAGIETGGGGGGAIIEYGSYTPAEDTVGLKCSSGRMAETHTFPSFLIMKKHQEPGTAETASSIQDGALMIWEKISVESGNSGVYEVNADIRAVGRYTSLPMTLYQRGGSNIPDYKDNYFDGAENVFYLFGSRDNMKYLAGITYDWIAIW